MKLSKKRFVLLSMWMWFATFVVGTIHANVLERQIILFLDFNDSFEVDTWVEMLRLKKDGCPPEVDLCNQWFLGYRPLQKLSDKHTTLVDWLQNTKLSPDIVIISGHHSNGFFGKLGRLKQVDLYPMSLEPEFQKFFTSPGLVYAGGCYTVASEFYFLEQDPAAYINRVVTHQELPRVQLMRSAFHQIATGSDPNPWINTFPNATLLGYSARGPGDQSHDNIRALITGFVNNVKTQLQTGDFSKAVYQVLKNAKYKNAKAGSSDFVAIAKWWATKGREQSSTSASSYSPKLEARADVVRLDPDRVFNKSDIKLTDAFVALVQNNSLLGSLNNDQLQPFMSDIDTVIDFDSLEPNLKAKIESACTKATLESPNVDLRRRLLMTLKQVATPSTQYINHLVIVYKNDPDYSVRSMAGFHLAEADPSNQDLTAGLIRDCSSKSALERNLSAFTLGKIKTSDLIAQKALVNLLSDSDREVRFQAKIALIGIGPSNPSIRSDLEYLSRDGNQDARDILEDKK